jgi:hypothetical protein
MQIYLAVTVRGDRGALAAARAVADTIERMGHSVLTRHLLEDGADHAEARITERDVFERDMEWLTAADVLIAEASGSSYGVGFEVGYVLGRSETDGGRARPRVLLLYDASRRSVVSRLIVGNTHPACLTRHYRDADDLRGIVERFLIAE